MRRVRAFLVLGTFFAFTVPLMPLQLLFLATGSRYARTFPHWYHRQVCRIVGIRLHIEGKVAEEQGVLLISNHVSWLDITVLSAVAPVSFVAKQEVASWPFVSWLAKLQRSVFVDRTRRNEVGDKANEILSRLTGGDHVVLFHFGNRRRIGLPSVGENPAGAFLIEPPELRLAQEKDAAQDEFAHALRIHLGISERQRGAP